MLTDLRHSVRLLRRRPLLSGAIVLTVALAISATTAVFAVVDGVLLEPLPYATPHRLVAVWESSEEGDGQSVVSPANFLAWRDEMASFDAMGSLLESSTTMIDDGVAEPVGLMRASAAYFEAVGAESVVGRLYGEMEDRPDSRAVAVLSEDFWRRRFGADPTVVGRTIELGLEDEGSSPVVIGVLDSRFDFEVRQAAFGDVGRHDIWLPASFSEAARQAGGRELQVVARLAPGATLESAQAEATALAARLAEAYPDRQEGWSIRVVQLREDLVGGVRSTLLVVLGAVCFVLLIASANVANLLMARASGRGREMAVRSALGASRGRLARQLFTESALLAGAGGVLGLILSRIATDAFVRAAPDIPRLDQVAVDGTVAGFALVATCGIGLLFGLAPSLSLGRDDTDGWLRSKTATARRRARRLRGSLLVAQVALSLVLLVGAGLLVRSLVNRLNVGLGFDEERLLTAGIQMGGTGYDEVEEALFFEELVRRVDGLPGVAGASAIGGLPLTGAGWRTRFWPLDRPIPDAGELIPADVRGVHRDYHRVMGIPLLAGRTFDEADRGDGQPVVVVSRTAADLLWPGESPIGKQVAMWWGDTLHAEVVGVVGDVRDRGPEVEPSPMFYWDHRQFSPESLVSLVARISGPSSLNVAEGVRAELADLDPGLPLYSVRPMEELFADTIRRPRLVAVSLGLFALASLVLAAIGIYGVLAHITGSRTQEIGIRMALGAGKRRILRMVLKEGAAQLGLAIVVGVLGALALARLLRGLVYDVSPYDPVTFAATIGIISVVSLAAIWVPARRASLTDPGRTIRDE